MTTKSVKSEVLQVDEPLFSNQYFSKKVSLTAANIKTLNSAPIILVAATGVGTAIEVISVSAKFNYVAAVAFDNGQLLVQPLGASSAQFISGATFLNNVADSFVILVENTAASTGNNLIANTPLAAITGADSTNVGTSNMIVYVAYRIITI